MSRYYQSSNKMPLGGVLTTLLGGLLAAAGLAVVYAFVTWYSPFVYLNFCFTVILGGGVGWVAFRLARRRHLRSTGGATGLALVAALAAVYVQWATYLTLMAGLEAGTTNTSFDATIFVGLLLSPAHMWKMMHIISATGSWTLLGVTPSGSFLWLIWLAEALIIALVALTFGADAVGHPYSETARAWATETTLPQLLAPQPDLDATRAALEAGRFDEALHPAPAAADAAALGEFWQLRLHHAPQDDACRYLSVDKLTRKLDKKGKPETDTDVLIKHLALSPAQYDALAARFGTAQAAAVPVVQS